MNYLIGLILLCVMLNINVLASNIRLEKELISLGRNEKLSSTTQNLTNESDEDGSRKITCHCNICTNAYYCVTNGACFLSSKFDQKNQKIYTQGCIDKVDDNTTLDYFCTPSDLRPIRYERKCCTKNLCNGNTTIPYSFDDNFSMENVYLLASVSAVIFLTLIAFILFFSCRLDMR